MTHTLRCYELPEMFRATMDRAIDPDTGEMTESGLCELRALTAAAQHSTADLACYVRELELEAQAINETVKALDTRVTRLTATAAKWRTYLLETLEAAGLDAVKDPRIAISIKTNPPGVHIDEGAQLPEEFCRFTPSRFDPDKTALKTALKAGKVIPGVSLTQTRRLTIQ